MSAGPHGHRDDEERPDEHQPAEERSEEDSRAADEGPAAEESAPEVPTTSDEDIDAQFAEIVRHLRATPQGPAPGQRRARWPGTGSSPTDPPNPPPPGFDPPPRESSGGPDEGEPPGDGSATGEDDPERGQPSPWREWEDPEIEEHFVPPDPPPLPAGDLHFWGILVGLLGGPLILLLAHGIRVLHGSVWTWLGLLLALGGFVLLVLRSPTDRHDDPSGGAQV